MFKDDRKKIPLKSRIDEFFIGREYLWIITLVVIILIYISLILSILLIPFIEIPLYHIEETKYDKTIYFEENFKEELRWTGLILLPHSEIYISFQTDRDVYLFLFNEQQYIRYLEKTVEGSSIVNLDCIGGFKDMDEGTLLITLLTFINPIYIIIDTDGASSEVEILFLTYRYSVFEKTWYLVSLIIYGSFLLLALISYYFKRRYNPWNYFHPIITELAREKFKNKNYDDAIRRIYNKIDSQFKTIAQRKGHGFKYGRNAINILMDESMPIIRLADITIEEGKKKQEDYKLFFKANFAVTRNPIAHNNDVFKKKFEALRQLGILDELLRILEDGIIKDETGKEIGYFDYLIRDQGTKEYVDEEAS